MLRPYEAMENQVYIKRVIPSEVFLTERGIPFTRQLKPALSFLNVLPNTLFNQRDSSSLCASLCETHSSLGMTCSADQLNLSCVITEDITIRMLGFYTRPTVSSVNRAGINENNVHATCPPIIES